MKAVLDKSGKSKFQIAWIIFFVTFFLNSGIFHFHKEANLHFHAEGLLTSDHTQYVEKDCGICDLYLGSSNSLVFNKVKIFLNTPVNFSNLNCTFETFSQTLNIQTSGRAPPLA